MIHNLLLFYALKTCKMDIDESHYHIVIPGNDSDGQELLNRQKHQKSLQDNYFPDEKIGGKRRELPVQNVIELCKS